MKRSDPGLFISDAEILERCDEVIGAEVIIGAALLGGWPGALIVVGAWAVLGTIADLLVDVMNQRV
jgi:hypothetical protein